ncbi:MAG: magnesium transporter [Salaquimonas sp.]|jgi:magnesium transporter|nr:magnesium transporter [Salaquimonas sp.]
MSSPTDEKTRNAGNADPAGPALYDEEGYVTSAFHERVTEILEADDADALKALIEPLHESELGDLLEALGSEERAHLVALAGDDFDLAALTEVDEAVRLEIVEALPNEKIAEAVKELDSDDAVYILEDLEESDQDEILSALPFEERLRLRRSLDYPEESAGRRMQTEFIAVPPFWSVGQTIDYMREDKDLPDRFHEIFVVSPQFELVGSVGLDQILRTGRKARIEEIMHETRHAIPADMDQEEAARLFERYDLLSAAVVDDSNRLVGVLTIDDVVDVIAQEAEEDILRLGGVGDEELSDSVWDITRSRFVWLLVNLGTAILASVVIGLFDASIEKMVALAVLMPIVASMGGNAGTQTMTVAVRAIATRDIDSYNALRIVRREILVGFFNGISFALIIGVVAALWFGEPQLGGIIAVAMVFNMLCAALAGILIPIALNRLGIDPAVASSVFVTTVTDVVGFFAFLGLAAWWFKLA